MRKEHDWTRALHDLGDETTRGASPCPSTEALAGYAEGRLDERGQRSVEGHLADCGVCLGQVRFLVRTGDLGPKPEVPDRLLEAVRTLDQVAEPSSRRRAPAWLAAAAALVLVVITIRFTAIDSPEGLPPSEETGIDSTRPGVDERTVRNHAAEVTAPSVVHPREGQRVDRQALTVAWEPVPDALEYSIQLMDGTGNLIWEDRSGASSSTIPPQVALEPGERYFVWVAAHLRSGLRAKSPAVGFEVILE